MRGLNILKQSEPPVNKPNSKLQALKTNLESNIPTEYNNLFNQKEVRKSNLDLTNQDYLTGYENYNDYAGGLDLNEIRAQNQPIFDKAAAGVGRIGTKAVSEIAKMPGVISGIIAAPFAEEGESWETAFNNQWIKSISQFNEDINDELLPVYVKKAVSEGNLWDNISSIDFWATEGADGIGFIASMFAPGAALKSLNLGHKILGTTAKGLSMLNGETKLAGAVRTLEGLGVTANNIDMAGITMANTLFESGSEAGSAMESFQKDLDKRLASGEINQQQYEQLQTQKAKLGRDIFISNLAILLVPNAIQTKMIWGKGMGSQLVKDTPSLMAKIGNRGKNVLGALGSEGFLEEGTQSTVETMFTNKANKGELTNNMAQDFNISELVSSYIDTLNTTDGQKAIFLGGVLGGGMSAYQGAKSDIATRKETADVLELAERTVGIFNRINETDSYKRDENGDIVYNYNNKPQYDPVKVRDIAKALNYTEEQSQLFDQAIQEGNTQVIQTLKNEAINQLITPFINKGELGIQALSQYLDTTLKTEEIAENEDAKALKSKIIEQATYMQDQLNIYKDFSKSLISLNNPDATEQDITDYYNRLGDIYINFKGSEYFQKGELKKLNIQKSKLLKDLGDNDITKEINTNFIEGTTEDIYKFKKSETDPRVKLLNDQIETVEKGLSEIDEIINGVIWNNEDVNKQFAKHIEANNKLREQSSPEQVAKNDEVLNTIGNALESATSVEDVDNAVNLTTDEHLENKITTNVEKIEDLEDKENSLKDELLNIESELSEAINTNNFNLKDELDKVYQDLLIELKENRDGLLQQSENLKQLKEQKQLEENNRLKKLKEKNRLEEKKRQDLSKQNKKIEEESKKIKLLEKKILLIQNIGNVVKVNGVTGILNKVNDSIFEVENENEIFEINLENLENLEIEKVKSLKERYNISKISETSVTVNNIEYKINVDNSGNIISLSPKNNSSQKIKNNDLLIVVEIERNKQDFNKRTPVRNINQRLKDNNYENIANILNTIYNHNLTDTVQSALNKLYSEKELTEQEKLQLGLWIQDAFDRLSNLFNSKNTDLENETLLNSYDNLEIILSLLYGKELKTTTKEFKNDKSNNIGKTEVDVSSERTSRQIESEKQTSKNLEIEKLNKEIEDLKSKITNLNLDTEKIIENYETSLKKTESTFISEANPIITEKLQVQAEAKKAEIIEAEKVVNETQIAEATQEDNDFNNVQTYDGLTGTEGSNITDDLIPQENENNTSEELKSIQNSEVDSGLGVKVISTDRNTGLPLQFISEQFPLYLEYEREPVNKSGKEVGFEINQNPGKNPKVLEALNAFNKGDFSDPKLLIDYLPINVQFTNEVKAPIETRRVNDEINPATELLRISIVNHLINGGSITNIKTTIQDQYKGLLKVDENRFANNNVLQLDGVKDIKYIRDNLYVVDSFGNLMNIQSGKTKTFSNGKVKPNAAGEIYLIIPQANGSEFPLKLNIKKINESEAVLLYEIYKEIITNEKSLDTTVSEVNDDLREAILKSFEPELNIIDGNKNDIKLQEIVDLLIYQSDNIKSRMQIENGVLYYGENEADINNIDESQNAIINYLVDSKRHQIKINPKFETDNTKTNLKSNSADYLKYLVDNNILSTNAVVNEPTFQGYTNIYLNTGITVVNQPKVSESGVEVSVDNTGFENLFENKPKVQNKVENPILSTIKSLEEKLSKTTRTVEMENDFSELPVEFFQYLNLIFRPNFTGNKNEAFDLGMNGPLGNQVPAGILYDKSFSKVISVLKETPSYKGFIKSLTENKSQNIRNVQKSFVSLSEIKGTVENTQITETQTEVFETKKVNTVTEQRLINKSIELYKEGKEMTDKQLARLEEWKKSNPEEFKKICR